jgi:hypothetical protein
VDLRDADLSTPNENVVLDFGYSILRREYRDRHLREEKRRQADWYRRKIAALQEDKCAPLGLFAQRRIFCTGEWDTGCFADGS